MGDLRPQLDRLGVRGARLFAVACVSRTSAAINNFATTQTRRTWERALGELWSLAERGPSDRDAASRLSKLIEACPEASIDDPYRRGYYAMRALGVMADAISTLESDSLDAIAQGANAASDGAISLFADLVYVGEHADTGLAVEGAIHFKLCEAIGRAPVGSEDVQRLSDKEPWPPDLFSKIDLARGWVRLTTPG